MKLFKGQCGFFQALKRSSCHINFYFYRKKIGNPVGKISTIKNIWHRFIAEYLDVGDGV